MNIATCQCEIPFSEMADGMLVKLILAGEKSAFEPLIRRYEQSLFSFIYHLLGNYDLACDILQDVFIKFYLSLPDLRIDQPLKPWLFQVARNRCVDELRRKHPISFSQLEGSDEEDEVSPIAILPDPDPLPEDIAEHHEFQQILHQAINELPLKYRQVVLLRYSARFSFIEIGRILNMPQATAKTYFQRARPLLRQALLSLGVRRQNVSV
jgi:RNA polymerase sigma factor (sigma-70 family)